MFKRPLNKFKIQKQILFVKPTNIKCYRIRKHYFILFPILLQFLKQQEQN